MACLKLTYYQENQLNLKVVWRKPEPGKPVPRFTSVDPLAEKYPWQSTYVYAAGNPIRYIDWMGLGPLGADELTDEEWMETSRPNSDSRMAREYRQQNLAAERAIADLSNFVHGKFKQNPHATVGGLLPGDWDGEGEVAKGGGTPWYSIYNWPALGSSARTMDALTAGDYLSATGHFLTLGAEVFTFGYSSQITTGFRTAIGNLKVPLYRVFGGEARAIGNYWSPINPKFYGSQYRNLAGLPNSNTGTFTLKATTPLRNINPSTIKPAAPLDGNFGRLVPELKVFDKGSIVVKNFWVNF
jgi:hypothetical protein